MQVRAIAAEIGVTDAAVNHHFGTREQLLESLRLDADARDRMLDWWIETLRTTVAGSSEVCGSC